MVNRWIWLVPALSAAMVTAVAAECIVYEHRDFRGARLVIGDQERVKMKRGESIGCTTNGHGGACPSVSYRPDWNDRISSYKVARGCTLFMWEDFDAGGWKLTRTQPAFAYIGDRRNDEVSEAYCRCS